MYQVPWECFFAQRVWGQVHQFLRVMGLGQNISFENVIYGLVDKREREWEVKVCLAYVKSVVFIRHKEVFFRGDCLQLAYSELRFYRKKGGTMINGEKENNKWAQTNWNLLFDLSGVG